jgi:ubiquinol-cytochrome c reductase cytochrome c1 subunit
MDISKEDTEANLIFTTDDDGAPTKFGSLMFNNMDKKYGKQKFGTNPPNLSLIARSRGADWVYTYLNSFYLDNSRPLGVNNTVFKDVGMPHALWELQGWQKAVYKTETNEAGTEIQVLDHLELASEGILSPEEYEAATRDLTAFLVYVAEPAQLQRKTIGIWVLLFLFIFTFVAYLLKKEYWKDVH